MPQRQHGVAARGGGHAQPGADHSPVHLRGGKVVGVGQHVDRVNDTESRVEHSAARFGVPRVCAAHHALEDILWGVTPDGHHRVAVADDGANRTEIRRRLVVEGHVDSDCALCVSGLVAADVACRTGHMHVPVEVVSVLKTRVCRRRMGAG